MPVCSIAKLLPLRTVEDLMHYCTLPLASSNSASGRPWHLRVIVYSYFMPVCSLVTTITQGAVDDLMHFCTRPSAIMHQVVHGTEERNRDQLSLNKPKIN